MKKNAQNSNDEAQSRERLIVPEEIFAEAEAIEEQPRDEQPEEPISEQETEEEISASDEAEGGEYEQIAFFEEERQAKELPSSEKAPEDDEEARDEDGYDEENPRLVDKIFDFLELFVFTVAAVFIITTFLFRHAIVEGDSMSGTLEHGEHLIISDLFYSPDVGDVVVFEDYTLPEGLRKPIVKRVIATGGDKVLVSYDGTVSVNGIQIPDEHARYEGGGYLLRDDQIFAVGAEYTVPEGCVFVLGDNRNNSTDSRCFGAIDEDAILGKVIIRIYPFDVFGGVD